MAVSVSEILAPTASSTSAASFTGTFNASASVGDILLINTLSNGAGTITSASLTDSVGNTYILDRQCAAPTPFSRTATFRTVVTKPIISGVTTVTSTAGGSAFHGLSGVVVTPQSSGVILMPNKGSTGAQQTSATPTTGSSGVLNSINELVIAQYTWLSGDTFAEPTNFTNPHGTGVKTTTSGATIVSSAIVYQLVAATTALNPSCTLGASVGSSGHIQTYFIQNAYTATPVRVANPLQYPPVMWPLFGMPKQPSQTTATSGATNATVTQVAGTVTASGGTQVITATQLVNISQVAATVTAGGGTQTVATVNNAAIAQVAGTVTAGGGTQVIATVNNVSITQVNGVVTAGGGTQVIVTSNFVAISQIAGVVTAGGGTQVISASGGGSVNATVTQAAGTVTATGGTQVTQSQTGPVNNYPYLIFDIEGNPYLRVTAHEYLKL